MAAVAQGHQLTKHTAADYPASPQAHAASWFRAQTNQVRKTKCLAPVRWTHRLADLPEDRHRKARIVAKQRWLTAQARSSRCERALAAAWANTPGARCVTSKEGGVRSVSPGGTYHGRWQMDADFQATYGPEFLRRWGVASTWPRWAQDIAAYRGWLRRGWNPWPNTARACGLI